MPYITHFLSVVMKCVEVKLESTHKHQNEKNIFVDLNSYRQRIFYSNFKIYKL